MDQTGRYIYLAAPVDIGHSLARISVAERLRARGIQFYDPSTAWTVSGQPHGDLAGEIWNTNEAAIAGAACILAVFDAATVGVPAELHFALQHRVPAVVVASRDYIARSYALKALATDLLTESIIEAVDRVADIAAGQGVAFLVQRGTPDLPLPTRHHRNDAGFDLYVSADTMIPPGESRNVPHDICIAPPPGIWYLILGRSSTLQKRGLLVVQSVIDNGYRGTLYAVCYNLTKVEQVIQRGDRVAQIIPMPWVDAHMREAVELPDSSRGADGFGSTGT